ncbi:hypothetical protein Moror_11891 [Moniliophthora roreri MCA 2997]|uniref:Uncharacterized protein n=1 Tax=Moniliophthora roreri (strain MCA 2997) TaxID=1381753 RepID=V2X3W0_MONRO|nr:hypothetical protein Moror_11891 [Moniliophthora roreri MCA 2997]
MLAFLWFGSRDRIITYSITAFNEPCLTYVYSACTAEFKTNAKYIRSPHRTSERYVIGLKGFPLPPPYTIGLGDKLPPARRPPTPESDEDDQSLRKMLQRSVLIRRETVGWTHRCWGVRETDG